MKKNIVFALQGVFLVTSPILYYMYREQLYSSQKDFLSSGLNTRHSKTENEFKKKIEEQKMLNEQRK